MHGSPALGVFREEGSFFYPCKTLVVLQACLLVRMRCHFCCVKATKVLGTASDSNLCNPVAVLSVLMNAFEARAVGVHAPFVPLILLVRCLTQVGESVIAAISISMIDLSVWPIARVQSPSDPMPHAMDFSSIHGNRDDDVTTRPLADRLAGKLSHPS